MSDNIPIVEVFRGVGVHDCQPTERIEGVVKPAIDHVHALDTLAELRAYAGDVTRPPEARLFAAAKCEAVFQIAVGERRERPNVNLEQVRASVAGLNSQYWRDTSRYCSLLDSRSIDQAVRREHPPNDNEDGPEAA